jgi:hypothetical protein
MKTTWQVGWISTKCRPELDGELSCGDSPQFHQDPEGEDALRAVTFITEIALPSN